MINALLTFGALHRRVVALTLVLGGSCCVAPAQSPVGYTEAVQHEVRRSVQLTGTVETRTESVVASEVAGLVVAMEVRAGDRVEAGQPLVRLRPRWYELQLLEARGRAQEAEARLALAESKLARARELIADQVISRQDLDDAVSEFTAWQGRDAQSRAEVERLEFSLERLVIRAPFAGAVVAKRTDLGEWVEQGGDVLELVALQGLEVRLEVPERYYSELQLGAFAQVGFESIPDLRIDGRLAAIIPRADPRSRTFPIKVALPDGAGRVGVGMLAKVDLPVGEHYPAVVVPKDAVVRQGSALTVFRITGEETVEPVPVTTRQGVGAWIVVEGPLAAGDRVVVRGNERLRPGLSVKGEPQEYPGP